MDFAYLEKEIIKKKFIFISYQHSDKELVEADIDWLCSNGVRLWYDTDLDYGDDWKVRVERIITNENCCGVFFYSSCNSYKSDPIFFERSLAKKEREKRGESKFFYLPVNIGKPTVLQLIKEVFAGLPDESKEIENVFGSDKLNQILEMFSPEVISCFADMGNKEVYRLSLLQELEKKAPEVIDSKELKLKKLEKMLPVSKGVPYISFGEWLGEKVSLPGVSASGINKRISVKGKEYIVFKDSVFSAEPLKWLVLTLDHDKVLLLSDAVIDIRKAGEELLSWLRTEFSDIAFKDSEKSIECKGIRLLTEKELNEIADKNILANPQSSIGEASLYWWIDAKAFGNNQKVVKTKDGLLYNNGLPRNKDVGVRPVIEIDFDELTKYSEV